MSTIDTPTGTHIVPACPEWCVLPTDHHLDDDPWDDEGNILRTHMAGEWTINGIDTTPIMLEVVRAELVPGPPAEVDGPGLTVYSGGAFLSPAHVAAFVTAVTEAAELLRAISGGAS